jgi:simple sugar transport system permease protein
LTSTRSILDPEHFLDPILQTFANRSFRQNLERITLRSLLADNHLRFLIAALIVILIAAAILSSGQFLDPYNFQSMAVQVPEIGLLAIAIAITMISGNGGIDLSVVSIANLSAIVAGLTVRSSLGGAGQGTLYAIAFVLIALLVGTGCGLINGFLVSRGNFPPILATLGTQFVFVGLAVALSGGPVVSLGDTEIFGQIGNGTILGVPIPFVIFIIVVLGFSWILTRTRFGFRLYLMGTNAKAANFTGINNNTIMLFTYTLSGILASIAGIIIASRTSSVKWDYGSSYLLIAILIAVMGGINPSGGWGKMLGIVLASFALQLLSSTFNFLGTSNFLKDFTWGLLLLLSIVLTGTRLSGFVKPKPTRDS